MKSVRKAGFLLVEILLAIGLMAVTLGVLLQAFSHALKNSRSAQQYQRASLLAEEKLWDFLWDEAITPGTVSGSFPAYPEMLWTVEAELLYRPEWDPELEEALTLELEKGKEMRELLPKTDLYKITVIVRWPDRETTREYQLGTYRLAPTPEEEEEEEEEENA